MFEAFALYAVSGLPSVFLAAAMLMRIGGDGPAAAGSGEGAIAGVGALAAEISTEGAALGSFSGRVSFAPAGDAANETRTAAMQSLHIRAKLDRGPYTLRHLFVIRSFIVARPNALRIPEPCR
jgi:hypothetical protein